MLFFAFWAILGPSWLHFGGVGARFSDFLVDLEVDFGWLWGRFEVILGSVFGQFRVTLGSLWVSVGVFGSLWDYFGTIVESLWVR